MIPPPTPEDLARNAEADYAHTQAHALKAVVAKLLPLCHTPDPRYPGIVYCNHCWSVTCKADCPVVEGRRLIGGGR